MADIYVKLSELSRPSTPVNDSDVVFISQLNNTENVSSAMSISDLRDLLNFETAFETTTTGLAATTANQIFYVYTDGQKLSVNPYYNRNGIAEAIVDSNSNKLVYSTLAFLQQWFTYYGYSLIKELESVDKLRTLPVLYEGQKVKVRGWRSPSYFGGGEFVGSKGTATDDGGVVFAGNGFYWTRAERNELTLYDFGAYGDGTNDDSPAFIRMTAYFRTLPVSRAFMVDGGGRTYVFTQPIEVDVSFFNIQNMVLDFRTVTAAQVPSGGNLYLVTITTTRTNRTEVQYRIAKMRGVELIGPAFNGMVGGTGPLTNIHGFYFKTGTSLNGYDAENLLVQNCHTAIVFSSHSYLLTYRKCRFLHCYAAVSDTKVLAGETLVDRGENLSFEDCVFDRNVYNLLFNGTDSQWEIRFKECSFDYFGGYGDLGAIYPFDMSTTQLLFFHNCHFEWGNNGSIVNNMFRCGGQSVIEIQGGTIRSMSSGTYGTIPVFFVNTGTSTFSLDDVIVNREGIGAWANYGCHHCRIRLKDSGDTVPGIVNTQWPNTFYNVQDANLVHPYSQLEFEVRGLDSDVNTDPHSNVRITAVPSSVTVGGVTYPSILITKLAGFGVGSYCDFKLYANRTVQSSVLNGMYCSIIANTVSTTRALSGSTGTVQLQVKGANGMYPPNPKSTSTFGASISLTSSTTTEVKFNASPVLKYHRNGQQMNKTLLRLDLTGLGASESIHVFKIFDYGPL